MMKLRATTNLMALFLAFAASVSFAQGAIEVISLRHRTAEQVIPVLRPLLEPGGALSGQGNQLIVRTSPENLAQLRQVLDSIDRPQRRLMISVRFDNSRSASDQRVAQQVQVLEGGEAQIFTGELRFWSDASTGIIAVPRLSGSNVTLELYAQQERYVRGAIQGQRAASTVAGRLSEWIELGGTSTSTASSGTDTLSSRESARSSDRRIWLMVEELR